VKQQRTATAVAFGKALREARKLAGISQEGLALSSGVDRTFVSMLERGIRQPALATILALCDGLQLRPGTLIDRVAVMLKSKRN